MGGTAFFRTDVPSMPSSVSEETVLIIRNNSQICVIHHKRTVHQLPNQRYQDVEIDENTYGSYTAW